MQPVTGWASHPCSLRHCSACQVSHEYQLRPTRDALTVYGPQGGHPVVERAVSDVAINGCQEPGPASRFKQGSGTDARRELERGCQGCPVRLSPDQAAADLGFAVSTHGLDGKDLGHDIAVVDCLEATTVVV